MPDALYGMSWEGTDLPGRRVDPGVVAATRRRIPAAETHRCTGTVAPAAAGRSGGRRHGASDDLLWSAVEAVLRVVDRRAGEGHRVVVSLTAPGTAPRESEATLTLAVDDADAERVRWYLEDYAEFPTDPAPQVARAAEAVLAAIGHQLHRTVFGGPDAGASWTLATTGPRGLAGLRVEVDADPADVPGLPWELLREPGTDQPLVLGAGEFVRTHRQTARPVTLPRPGGEPLRVLLVICRPGGREDVPFRSVASRLVRSGADRMHGLELHVLRPPTFAQLGAVLRAAADAGTPYHVVHFDGHGAYLDATMLAADLEDELPIGPLRFGTAAPARPGRHGYLVFEQPENPQNGATRARQELVDGPTLARVLVEAGVPVLVLNACRSAYTDAAPHPPDTTPRPTPHRLTRRPARQPIRPWRTCTAGSAPTGHWPRRWPMRGCRAWWPCATTSTSSPRPSSSPTCTRTWSRAARSARP